MSQPLEINRNVTKSYVSLGANAASRYGNAADTLNFAISRLSGDSVKAVQTSPFFSTPAFPIGSGPDFVNAVAEVETTLPAIEFMDFLHEIETKAGRKRNIRWEQRTLDLDLISYGDAILPNIEAQTAWVTLPIDRQMKIAPEELIVPHPRIQDRAFVLVPLHAVNPEWTHPVTKATITQLLAALPQADIAAIRPL